MKPVNAEVLGLFIPKAGSQAVDLYPSPDLIEAGKFKLPKFITQMMVADNYTYE